MDVPRRNGAREKRKMATTTKNDLRLYWAITEVTESIKEIENLKGWSKGFTTRVQRLSDLFSDGAGDESDREWLQSLQGRAACAASEAFHEIQRALRAFAEASIDIPGDLAASIEGKCPHAWSEPYGFEGDEQRTCDLCGLTEGVR